MKKSFICIFITLMTMTLGGYTQTFQDAFANPEIKGVTYTLSFPRSGRTWVTYMLKTLYGLEFLDPESVMNRNVNVHTNPPYRSTHVGNDLKSVDHDHNKIILFLRNYKECIRRNYDCDTERAYKSIKSNKGYMQSYIKNLKTFDRWNPDSRLIVYYEEVIAHPRETFEKLAIFLGMNTSPIEQFMQDFEMHRQICLERYTQSQGYSASQGKDVQHHTKEYTAKQIKTMNKKVKQHHPDLWKKYLYRYD